MRPGPASAAAAAAIALAGLGCGGGATGGPGAQAPTAATTEAAATAGGAAGGGPTSGAGGAAAGADRPARGAASPDRPRPDPRAPAPPGRPPPHPRSAAPPGRPPPDPRSAAPPGRPSPDPRSAAPPGRSAAAQRRTGGLAARPLRRVALRKAPGGRAVAVVGSWTGFGSPRYLAVVRRHGGWLGVLAPELPNGRIGWIAARDARLYAVPVRLRVDLSARELRVLRGRRTVLRITVAIGSPAHPTPTGRFAVTDGLRGRPGSPYGCCVLALSGHQPDVPQGWTGGDRLAVHGTNAPSSIGDAVSLGCLRARDGDLRRLMAVAPLGAVVEIRR